MLSFRYHWFLVLLMGIAIPLLTAKTEKPGEFYPFSNFPMYSTFEPETYYVYVTDAADKPLPIGTLFGKSPSDVKKIYDRKLTALKPREKGKRKMELSAPLKAEAANETLQWLEENIAKENKDKLFALGKLRLHEVVITYADGVIRKSDTLTGERALATNPAPTL
jgi:hypothetical protein